MPRQEEAHPNEYKKYLWIRETCKELDKPFLACGIVGTIVEIGLLTLLFLHAGNLIWMLLLVFALGLALFASIIWRAIRWQST
jgi:hypothetical protein